MWHAVGKHRTCQPYWVDPCLRLGAGHAAQAWLEVIQRSEWEWDQAGAANHPGATSASLPFAGATDLWTRKMKAENRKKAFDSRRPHLSPTLGRPAREKLSPQTGKNHNVSTSGNQGDLLSRRRKRSHSASLGSALHTSWKLQGRQMCAGVHPSWAPLPALVGHPTGFKEFRSLIIYWWLLLAWIWRFSVTLRDHYK